MLSGTSLPASLHLAGSGGVRGLQYRLLEPLPPLPFSWNDVYPHLWILPSLWFQAVGRRSASPEPAA